MNVYLVSRADTPLASSDESFAARFRFHNQDRSEVCFVDSPSRADVVILFEEFSFKQILYRETLANDAFVACHCERLFTVNYDDSTGGFLPGCYTSLQTSNFDPALHRACAYPKVYNTDTAETVRITETSPDLLFSFRGSIHSHPSRSKLCRIYEKSQSSWSVTAVNTPFNTHSSAEKQEYASEILRSHFVLCPRGSSPSTYRLFEVMAMGRCPVIISDAWVPPEGVDWEGCSIRIPENRLRSIPSILQSQFDRASELGLAARVNWEQHFSESAKYRAYWTKIDSLMREPRQSLDSMLLRWHSDQFISGNRWKAWQRFVRRLTSIKRFWT